MSDLIAQKGKNLYNILFRKFKLKVRTYTHILLASFMLGHLACSKFPPAFYYTPVEQGFMPSDAQLAKVKIGMPKETVFKILGNPNLNYINDKDHYDYIEYKSQGAVNHPKKTRLQLIFNNSKLKTIKKL